MGIHGDGAVAGKRGFHVIVATHSATRAASERYAEVTRSALRVRVRSPRRTPRFVVPGGELHLGELDVPIAIFISDELV